jgi:MoaA/NifB/PqqE/SkfB family radical SAM enzyme
MAKALRHLNIEVTRRCDQRCTYCFNDSGPQARCAELTLDEWVRLFGRLSRLGLESVHITGGEPFVSPATIPILREVQTLGLSTSVLSNGLRIPTVAQQNPDLLQRLTVAQISLDGMDPAMHDKRRGKIGAWRQAMLAIESLQQLGVPLEISCTVDRHNLPHIGDLACFVRSIGASLILRPIVRAGRACFAPSENLRTELTQLIFDHADVLACDRFRYVPSGPRSDNEARDAGILTILPDGRFRSGSISIASKQVFSTMELLAA